MRHGIAGNRLSRNSKWREATVRDIAKATLIRQQITTTKARAKEARKLIDRLITLGKKGTLAHKRRAFAILGDHQLVSELFNKTALRFKARNGGYTRIIAMSERRGDNAHMVLLELTEKEVIIPSKPKVASAKKEKPEAHSHAHAYHHEAGSEKASATKELPPAKIVKPQLPDKKADVKKPISTEKKIVSGIKKIFRRKQGE